MNKKQFLESLKDVYCRIAVTKNGVGLVAIRPIPKGTDPFKNCDPFGDVLEIPEDEFEKYKAPNSAKMIVRDFCALQDGVYFVPDYGIDALPKCYYLNHDSKKANMITRDRGEIFLAKRHIKTGEELLANYDEYHESRHFDRN